tara:strand:+ start:566 stop:1609 length:1044 start_codon:yes stop_codon:yes gene_type:complete
MSYQILHLSTGDKFLSSFISFINKNFDSEVHKFLLLNITSKNDPIENKNVFLADNSKRKVFIYYFLSIIHMHTSKKIILHGLFDFKIVLILFFMPWLLRKCHWIIWGGDLYIYKSNDKKYYWYLKEIFRRPIIKRFGFIITYIKGDYALAQKWYGAKGSYIECISYPSNLSPDPMPEPPSTSKINILVGNSGSASNNHEEVFLKLEKYKNHDVSIYVPLTYGDASYIEKIIKQGQNRFGDNFFPITEHMSNSEYQSFLNSIDIAAFNHPRQQGMGNIISLLGYGKKVFIRSDITSWEFFLSKDIFVFDVNELEISSLSNDLADMNKRNVQKYFSTFNFKKQLRVVLD